LCSAHAFSLLQHWSKPGSKARDLVQTAVYASIHNEHSAKSSLLLLYIKAVTVQLLTPKGKKAADT